MGKRCAASLAVFFPQRFKNHFAPDEKEQEKADI
jgi:hypothetical protein